MVNNKVDRDPNLMKTAKPLKILMLTSSYPRDQEDLAGIFLRHMAENLVQRGVEVHVLVPASRQGESNVERGR